jgi:hypothetical protein
MKNPCLVAALQQLEAAGVRNVETVHGSKHPQLRWRVNGNPLRVLSIPGSSSDWRGERNTRADVRRLLRMDGVELSAPNNKPTGAPRPQAPDRVAVLERRVEKLERTLQELGA